MHSFSISLLALFLFSCTAQSQMKKLDEDLLGWWRIVGLDVYYKVTMSDKTGIYDEKHYIVYELQGCENVPEYKSDKCSGETAPIWFFRQSDEGDRYIGVMFAEDGRMIPMREEIYFKKFKEYRRADLFLLVDLVQAQILRKEFFR